VIIITAMAIQKVSDALPYWIDGSFSWYGSGLLYRYP